MSSYYNDPEAPAKLWMPMLCMTCGLPLANFQATYEHLVDGGTDPEDVFALLHMDNDCCRAQINNALPDPRMLPTLPMQKTGFCTVTSASKLDAKPFVLCASGRTEPLSDKPTGGTVP